MTLSRIEDLMSHASIPDYPTRYLPTMLSDEEKMAQIAEHFGEIMRLLGLDLSDPSLKKTPQRVAEMYVKEVFCGLDPKTFPAISFIANPYPEGHEERLVLLKVGFTSFCEHHFVPMIGTAYIGYVPHERVIGFSTFSKIVRHFCQRPQIQERLSAQIADSLTIILQTDDIAVSMTAQHFCMISRETQDHESEATTQVLRGAFKKDPALVQQFLAHCQS